MYPFSRQLLIKPEMSKYIRETTNKSVNKYLVPYNLKPTTPLPPNSHILLFVSLISFSIGYKVGNLLGGK
jgi:hypothetical protein